MTLSQRQLRVGELVRHALSDILMRGEVHDPELSGRPVTIPEVRMSADLKIATVLVMPLGGENAEATVKALARNARPLRAELSKRIRQLKYMPTLRFLVDTRFDDDDRVRDLLSNPRVAADVTDADGKADREAERDG